MDNWRQRAKCANDPIVQDEIWNQGYDRFHDGSKGQRSQVAKTYCPGCPVMNECFAEAMQSYQVENKVFQHVHGVWGGTTDTQRTGRWRKNRKAIREIEARWKELFPDKIDPIAS